MTIYNVMVPVVALIDATSEQHAIDILKVRIGQRGGDLFDVFEDGSCCNAFESEDDANCAGSSTEPDKTDPNWSPWSAMCPDCAVIIRTDELGRLFVHETRRPLCSTCGGCYVDGPCTCARGCANHPGTGHT